MAEKNGLDLFYQNSSILITGGNGFVGKALVETLLRCFEVKKIYLLLRAKKGESVEKRVEMMFQDKLFDKLRESGKLSNVQAVSTNFQADDIISNEDEEMITNDVNIVFHSLASIHFKESLQNSVETNMLYAQKVIGITKKIKNLKSFVHVSTVYSNSNREEIDEVIYDRPLKYKELFSIADYSRQLEGDKSMKFILKHDFPNVYCLTKHYGEKMVVDLASDLPTAIFRPPAISSAYKSLPGWTDNLNHYSKFAVNICRGYLHCWLAKEDNVWNLAPVDYCVNALVAVAWDVSEKFKNIQENEKFTIPIYNYMFDKNNIRLDVFFNYLRDNFNTPLENSFYYISCIMTSSLFWFNILFYLTTTLPAICLDRFLGLLGKKSNFRVASSQLKVFLLIGSPFLLKKFKFGNENIKSLIKKVKNLKGYRDDLDFDYESIDWREYFENWMVGIKQYCLKEDITNCSSLVSSYRRKKYLHNFLKYSFLMLGCYFIVCVLEMCVKKVNSFIL